MSSNLSIKLPGNDEEFERWCLWLAREKYGPDVFLYTRKKQHGIDIYWQRRGKYFVIQCKQRSAPDPAELIRSFEADFETARNYFGTDMEQFVFAATISLEQANKDVRRENGNTESLLGAIGRLGSTHNVSNICWHWDGIESDIADSPFLVAHLLGQEKGGELINEDFFADQVKKHDSDIDLKNAFYGGKKAAQWNGIVKQLDAPRQAYQGAMQAIENSFRNDNAVAALIKGDGGCGKSILLRRLAHDLCADYTVYWLESDIQGFLDCEWPYDVLKHGNAGSPPKYLIFLEDWYQNVENSGLQSEAGVLLAKVNKTSHVRLVIGDRKAKLGTKKTYEAQVSSASIFELSASENISLLDTIFTKMPEWKSLANLKQIENAANATLFQLLFIFQHAEDRSGDITDIYKRIFISDCRELLARSTAFWQGMTKAIFFYANLYVHEGVVVSVEFLRDLAAHFGECPIPERYSTSNEKLLYDNILMKYFGLNTTKKKNAGVINLFRFHHDTMADSGWMLLGDFVAEQYDEATLQAVLEYFKDEYPWIVGPIYYRQTLQPGNKGMEAARRYLNMNHPENNQNAFTDCLQKLRDEELAKNKARIYLSDKSPWENYTAFTVCLDLLKAEELAKIKARAYLSIENPWATPEAFTACLSLLKTEELAKSKARLFLYTKDPWKIRGAFVVCLNLVRDEKLGVDHAVFILLNRQKFNSDHHWTLLFRSLIVLCDKPEHRHLVALVANAIIANKHSSFFRYRQLLKIPLFHVPQWVEASEQNISNWPKLNPNNPEQPLVNRNTMYSITIGYIEKLESIEAMCLGLIRNWKFELRIKQKHQAYLIRCLAHPAIQRDDKLRLEIIAICKEILNCVTQPPLIINEGTRFWLESIVECNQFPEWSYEN